MFEAFNLGIPGPGMPGRGRSIDSIVIARGAPDPPVARILVVERPLRGRSFQPGALRITAANSEEKKCPVV